MITNTIVPEEIENYSADVNEIRNRVADSLSCLSNFKEKVLKVKQLYTFASTLQQVSFETLEQMREDYLLEVQKDYHVSLELLIDTNKSRKDRFTVEDALKITGIKSKTTIYSYIEQGILKAQKVSNRYYFLREDLRAYVGHDNF